jgi:hypothetical protein
MTGTGTFSPRPRKSGLRIWSLGETMRIQMVNRTWVSVESDV